MRGWLIALLAALLAGGLVWRSATRPASADQGQVKTATVKRGDIVVRVSAPGQVMPRRHRTLFTKTGGLVRDVLVRSGQEVEAGDVLLRLDSGDLRGQIAAQQAQVRALQVTLAAADGPEARLADAAVTEARLALAQAQQQLARARAEYRLGAIPRQQVEQADAAAGQARAALEAARLRVTQAGQTRAGTRAQLDAAWAQLRALQGQASANEVRAPMSGTVTDLPVAPGQALAADAPLATVSDLSGWIVQARVPENDMPDLEVGTPVEVTVEALEGEGKIGGKVVALGQTKKLQPPEGPYYYQVDSQLAETELNLIPELSATTDFITDRKRGVPVLPLTALRTVGGKTVVEVLKDGKRRFVEVKPGVDDGTTVAIEHGVEPGTVVVLPPPPGEPQNAPGGLGNVLRF